MKWRACLELKRVPSKGRIYRYWYLRIPAEGGRWLSVYIGKEKPSADQLEKLIKRAKVREPGSRVPKREARGMASSVLYRADHGRFRDPRSPVPKPGRQS